MVNTLLLGTARTPRTAGAAHATISATALGSASDIPALKSDAPTQPLSLTLIAGTPLMHRPVL